MPISLYVAMTVSCDNPVIAPAEEKEPASLGTPASRVRSRF
jgi:hypothetical protein